MQQTRSFSNPSQYSWNAALKDIQSAQQMDEVFNKVCCISQAVDSAAIKQTTSQLCMPHLLVHLRLPGIAYTHAVQAVQCQTSFRNIYLLKLRQACAELHVLQVYLAIEQHSALLKRDAAVRLKLWLTKLSEQVS